MRCLILVVLDNELPYLEKLRKNLKKVYKNRTAPLKKDKESKINLLKQNKTIKKEITDSVISFFMVYIIYIAY